MADLKRGAFHPEISRELTLEELLGRIAKHGSSHLEQIEKLKKQATTVKSFGACICGIPP